LRRLRPRLDGFEAAVLAALAALSVAVLAGLLVRVWTQGGIVTGSDGFLVVDQLQYLNWLRQAGEHAMVTNLYDIGSYPRDYLHPGVLVSGLLHRLGLGLAASYMVWKPVAVAALFAAALLYARRFLPERRDRRLALVLALFTVSPLSPLVGWSHIGGPGRKLQFDFLTNEMWPGNYLWGYLFTALAVALVPLGLLAYERGRGGGPQRMLVLAGLAGLFSAWFQPWQGATFAAVIVAGELLCRRRPLDAARDLAVPLVATALPLGYYLVLQHVDDAWKLAGIANDTDHIHRWPVWVTVLGLLPLGLPALLAYRERAARRFGDLALRAWPPLAILLFYLPLGTFPFHAFQGLALPLAVLAAITLRRVPTAAAVAFAAVLILPGTAYQVDQIRSAVNHGFQPFFLKDQEHDALTYLDSDPRPGGVLAPVYSGLLVPAYTGRQSWVGAGSWTPHFEARRAAAERLFGGRLSPAQARSLVRASGASFLYSDCHGRADIQRTVAAFTEPPRRFGCAEVYRVRQGGP
jgi:hypothetical protein